MTGRKMAQRDKNHDKCIAGYAETGQLKSLFWFVQTARLKAPHPSAMRDLLAARCGAHPLPSSAFRADSLLFTMLTANNRIAFSAITGPKWSV